MQVMGTTRHQASARQLPKSQHKRHQKKKNNGAGNFPISEGHLSYTMKSMTWGSMSHFL